MRSLIAWDVYYKNLVVCMPSHERNVSSVGRDNACLLAGRCAIGDAGRESLALTRCHSNGKDTSVGGIRDAAPIGSPRKGAAHIPRIVRCLAHLASGRTDREELHSSGIIPQKHGYAAPIWA